MRLLLPQNSPFRLPKEQEPSWQCQAVPGSLQGGCRCSLGTEAPRPRCQQQQELLGAGEHVKQIEVITHPPILMETRGNGLCKELAVGE